MGGTRRLRRGASGLVRCWGYSGCADRLAGVLDIYKLDVGNYPTSDQGLAALIVPPQGIERWNGPYIKGEKVPEDPWGHPFVYRFPSQRPGHEYDLYSLGPSGQAGGTGDNAPIYNN